jgi:Intracellular proteinase inhibitor
MNTRLIISLLCAGALAFACGPRSHSEAPSALATAQTAQPVRAATPAARSHRVSSKKSDVQLASHLAVVVRPSEVRFALDVTNVGKKHAELDFPNGQAYDIVVVDSAGREVWHWAEGRMFTQSMQNKQLGGGESMQIAESWTPAAGHYTVIATLKSSNYPVEERADFVVR